GSKVHSHDACDPVFDAVVAAGRIDADSLWWRFRHQIHSRQPEQARRTLQWLGVDASSLDAILARPEAHFDGLTDDFSRTRAGRELALAALVRIARSDVPPAQVRFLRRFEHFSAQEREW